MTADEPKTAHPAPPVPAPPEAAQAAAATPRRKAKKPASTFAEAAGGKRRGRKALALDDQKSSVLTLRLSPADRTRLTAIAAKAGMSESEYVRRTLHSSRVAVQRPADGPQTDAKLVSELGRIGVNLNQIAHIANARNFVPAGLVPVLVTLTDILDRITAALPRRKVRR